MLVEAEHLAMEEIMSSVTDDNSTTHHHQQLQQQQLLQVLPVAVVCQRHLDTMLQRVSPSVKVRVDCLYTTQRLTSVFTRHSYTGRYCCGAY